MTDVLTTIFILSPGQSTGGPTSDAIDDALHYFLSLPKILNNFFIESILTRCKAMDRRENIPQPPSSRTPPSLSVDSPRSTISESSACGISSGSSFTT
ncbi:unnamed protein product [Ophioblennius macclurei]